MPDVDRPLRSVGNHLRGRLLIVLIASTIAIGLITSLLIISLSEGNPPASNAPAGIQFIIHAPISINGNAGFLGPNATTGITKGSGTASDPYIINGWRISAHWSNAISIGNTTKYLRIEDCYLNDTLAPPSGKGIQLLNVSNTTLKDNYCYSNAAGILLHASSNNTLINNTCSTNTVYGIRLESSSDKNTLINNTCFFNQCGISIDSSNGDTLNNNTCYSNKYGIVPGPSPGIVLYQASGCSLTNNTCWGQASGIVLNRADGNTLVNNNFSSNIPYSGNWGYGILLFSSSNNALSWNYLWNNTRYGAYIDSSSISNSIWNNTLKGNNGAGSVYNTSHIQAYDDGTNNRWNSSGTPHGYGNNWSDWRGPDLNSDGIVDFPYTLGGSAGSIDYYPHAEYVGTPIPEFSELIIPIFGLILIALVVGRTRKKA